MRALGWLLFGLFLLYLVLPMLAPVVYSFSQVWLGLLPEGLTLAWYRKVFTDPKYLEGALLSLRVALLAVALNVLVGVPTAYVAHTWTGRVGEGLRRLLQVLPLLVPPLVVGLGFLLAFNRPPLALSGTFWIVVFGHAALGFPFFFRTVYAGLSGLEVRLLMERPRPRGRGFGRGYATSSCPTSCLRSSRGAWWPSPSPWGSSRSQAWWRGSARLPSPSSSSRALGRTSGRRAPWPASSSTPPFWPSWASPSSGGAEARGAC